MVELDCLGDMCPIPIMKLKQCEALNETAVCWNPSPITAANGIWTCMWRSL